MRVVPLAFVILVAFAVDATADRSVDWSQYIEQPGDRPLKVTSGPAPAVVAAAEAAPKTTKASKAKKAKQAKKSKKAKARRTKARAKKRK